jgi:hypothetical protein
MGEKVGNSDPPAAGSFGFAVIRFAVIRFAVINSHSDTLDEGRL